MDTLKLFNIVAIICEVVGLLAVVIGVLLRKYSKDNFDLAFSGVLCLAAGIAVHIILKLGLLNFLEAF